MSNTYVNVDYPNPHLMRAKKILAAHPEVRSLMGPTPSTALHIIAIVALQTLLAIVLRNSPVWEILLVSYFIGAIANHAMWVMIHDCGHNLVFRSTAANNLMNIVANLPIVFPSAISFRKYHLFHHRYQGEMLGDADLATPAEADLVGSSPLRKSLWLFFFFIIEGVIRPLRIKGVQLWCRWTVLNYIVEFSFLGALWYVFGWKTFMYLGLSTFFSIGLHPVGARWIQEHYIFPNTRKPNQETFSYYGPMNLFAYNIGYHNEHHDLMMIAWSRLPKLKALAPEMYDGLYFHTSYLKIIYDFLFNREVTLYSRVVRPDRSVGKAAVTSPAALGILESEEETVRAGSSDHFAGATP